MSNNIKVLDEREIYFGITDGVFELYDQKDALIGERPLPIPVHANMSIDEIYQVANDCGYNVSDMISDIIGEAVMENRTYDVWLQQDSMIFYSPSAAQFVAEPYEGIFFNLEREFVANLQSDIALESEDSTGDFTDDKDESDVEVSEKLDILKDETVSDEENPLDDEELIEKDPEPNLDFSEKRDAPSFEDAYAERFKQELEQTPQETNAFAKGFEDAIDVDVVEVSKDMTDEPFVEDMHEQSEASTQEPTQDLNPAPVHDPVVSTSASNVSPSPTQAWKEAYTSVLRDNRTVDGVNIKELRDKVVEIVLQRGEDVLTLNETEILLELMEMSPVIIDGKTVVKAGLYQAYLLLKD